LVNYLALCLAKKRIKSLEDAPGGLKRLSTATLQDNVNGVACSSFIAREVAFLRGDSCGTARKITGPSIRDVQVRGFWGKEGTPL
jgi:hypothetical protein